MNLPHGTIFLEPRLEEFVTDAFKIFFENLSEITGWKLLYDSNVTADKFEGDVLLINNMPVANFPHCRSNLGDVQRFKGKVIVFLRDVHARGNTRYVDEMKKLLDRADLILTFSNEYFLNQWGQYGSKHVWFPIYFAPTNRFYRFDTMPLSCRKHACLVPGMAGQAIYPLRHLAVVNSRLCCDTIPVHPSYDKLNLSTNIYCIREKYADLLHSHCCVLTDGSIYNYLLQKHMEIPACGSLLLTNRFADLDKAGFMPGVHYVEIDEDNYQDRVMAVVCNPREYQDIANAGMSMVIEHYSMERALIRMIDILEKKYAAV